MTGYGQGAVVHKLGEAEGESFGGNEAPTFFCFLPAPRERTRNRSLKQHEFKIWGGYMWRLKSIRTGGTPKIGACLIWVK